MSNITGFTSATNVNAPGLTRSQMARYGLNNSDIGMTIDDENDGVKGIYFGVRTLGGREFNRYAALTDAHDKEGTRLALTFKGHVAYLLEYPDGENLFDYPALKSPVQEQGNCRNGECQDRGECLSDMLEHQGDISYEKAMQARITALRPGERTKQMIPTLFDLEGHLYTDEAATNPHNLFKLQTTGDFSNSFVVASSVTPPYVSCTESPSLWPFRYNVDFKTGVIIPALCIVTHLRTISLELRPQP